MAFLAIYSRRGVLKLSHYGSILGNFFLSHDPSLPSFRHLFRRPSCASTASVPRPQTLRLINAVRWPTPVH